MNQVYVAALPLIFGFIIDSILGDPYSLPHPVRLIGNGISGAQKLLRKKIPEKERAAGRYLVVMILTSSTLVPGLLLAGCYWLDMWLGIAVESILCYYLIAARCLKKESMKVYRHVTENDVEGARKAVSMIVGRDTDRLDREGIIKAAVETVAENTSDGVTAPIFYMAFGGAVFGFFYKAANTMDSMVGYQNEKYKDFGRCAAKFDDIMNWIPSRMTALLMIAASYLLGLDGKGAYRIWKRDRRNHASPNSAQTEAVCAGALNVQLAGDAWYFGELHQKPTIGDPVRPIEAEDIKRANRLMYGASLMMLAWAVAVRLALFWFVLAIIW